MKSARLAARVLPLTLVVGVVAYVVFGAGKPVAAPTAASPALPRDRCRQCHENEYARWERSPHGRHAVAQASPPGAADLAIGSVWMQAFFRTDAEGLHRIVPVCRDLRASTWRPVVEVLLEIAGQDPAAMQSESTPLGVRSFERDCAACHASGPALAYSLDRERVTGGWRDAAIDCEACHGDGDEHVRQGGAAGTIASLAGMSPRTRVAVCGRCHGGPPVSDGFTPQDAAHWIPVLMDHEGLYPNGEAAGQTYQVDPFVRSACYSQGGLTCTDCHGAHDTRVAVPGTVDALCLSCHALDPAAHTHHAPQSPGSRCVACHMPRLREGVVAHQRTHHIGIPLPALVDIPSACARCHADQSAAWADRAWQVWWGAPPQPTLDAVAAIRGAREGASEPARRLEVAGLLERTRHHADPFYRAAAIQYAGPRVEDLQDPDPAVRLAAARSAAARKDLVYLRRALNDSEARIRGEAAVVLFAVGEEIPSRHWNDVSVVAGHALGDVSAHLLLALRHAGRGDEERARTIFQRLLARTPDDQRAWMAWAEFECDRNYLQRARRALARALALWMQGYDLHVAAFAALEGHVRSAVDRGKVRWGRVLLSSYAEHLRRPDLAPRVAAMRRQFLHTFGKRGS